MTQPQMRTWRVIVHGVGDIGCIASYSESDGRCVALSKYGEVGPRPRDSDNRPNAIYEDDEFDVRPT
jgi:hypothetical protein